MARLTMITLVLLGGMCTAQTQPPPGKPKVSTEGKTNIAGTLQSTDPTRARVTLKDRDGHLVKQDIGAKFMESLRSQKKGS